MSAFGSSAQATPEPFGITEPIGPAENGPAVEPGDATQIGAAQIGAAQIGSVATGSHAVIPPGVDADLPDDADDVADGVPPPRSSPRVTPDEKVVPAGRHRKSVRQRRLPR
jgi:hypothetical protein